MAKFKYTLLAGATAICAPMLGLIPAGANDPEFAADAMLREQALEAVEAALAVRSWVTVSN